MKWNMEYTPALSAENKFKVICVTVDVTPLICFNWNASVAGLWHSANEMARVAAIYPIQMDVKWSNQIGWTLKSTSAIATRAEPFVFD